MTDTAPTPGPEAGSAGLYRLVRERSSCRGFLPDPVERSVVETVLEIARHSPSWCNTQPWHLAITEGEGTEAFRRALDAHVRSGATPEPDSPSRSGTRARPTGAARSAPGCSMTRSASPGATGAPRPSRPPRTSPSSVPRTWPS